MTRHLPAATLVALAAPYALSAAIAQARSAGESAAIAQARPAGDSPCRAGHATALAGTVHDSTRALIPGAALTLDDATPLTSGSDGRFRFACVAPGTHRLRVQAEGFALLETQVQTPRGADVDLVLQPANVEIGVQVNADEVTAPDTQGTGTSQTIAGKQLQALADDPDDLQRQLQQLGAAAGGNPANTTISVNGFQESSKLPPKSSIAYIKVNPDLYSAEYREPPFEGGRLEVYTKPGQPAFHGALFATNSSAWMNASDPFATSKAPLGKQRYGFELNGPIRKQGSDFSLTLEHRAINDFGVVNATTLDVHGNPVHVSQNIATPQRLWVGEARVDWQLGAKNTFIATYSPNVNSFANQGVGGLNLPESGYGSGYAEHVLRFTDITTITPHLMHEARVQLHWVRETDAPNSTAPQLQVSGAFTGGGATIGAERLRNLGVEVDDDAILTTPRHTLKFGTQLGTHTDHDELTSNFNGTYLFGGGVAPVLNAAGAALPGQTESITGVEQYRRALLNLPGGAPTAFSNVAGTPVVRFTQVNNALFVQDEWNVGKGVHLATGLRYFVQTDPTTRNGLTPRLGILWSPTKKGTWTLHAHEGLFSGVFRHREWAEVLREDGTDRVTSTGYNAVYCSAAGASGCDPFAGIVPIHSQRAPAAHLGNSSYAIGNIGGTRALPFGWNLSLDYYWGRLWNEQRSNNVNAPLDGSPTGRRALGVPNLDLLQVQNSGQGRANVEFVSVEQHTLKRVQMFVGAVRVNLLDDSDDDAFATPQSAFSNAGELAHRSNQPVWNLFGNASFTLPSKVILSGNLNGSGDAHYNLTTGFDNNGDGDFNDRPQYAAAGAPNAVQTRYGLLTASGGTGVFPRNKGVLPWRFYLDTNLQRAFTMTHNAKAEHQQTLTVNLRAANLLNHTNVTAVGGVLGSPTFGVPYAADTGRRVEAGLRYSF